MLAKAGPLPEGPGWSYEPKYDGFRFMGTSDGSMFIGRNAVPWWGADYIADALRQLPDDTHVDGELISPNAWGAVATVVKRTQADDTRRHEPTDESPALEFVVFDVIRWNGTDYTGRPFAERRQLLDDTFTIPGIPHLSLAPNYRDPDPKELYATLVHGGWEGVMAKHDDGLYRTGRIDSKGKPKSQRAPLKEMVKCKAQHTIDVIVTAIYPPEHGSWLESEGLPGRLGYAYRDGAEVGLVGTGFDRATRQHIAANPDEWLNHVIEIGHMTVDKNAARPRHPSFIRRRDDKELDEATEAPNAN